MSLTHYLTPIDKLIQGREVIDSKDDAEEIDQTEWEEELELEQEEDVQVLHEKGGGPHAF